MSFTKQEKESMIYPPVNDLVARVGEIARNKTIGNRYSLVLIAAKRARDLAKAESSENRKAAEAEPAMHPKDRLEKARKNDQPVIKPIVRALGEIMSGELYVTDEDETYTADDESAYKQDAPLIINDNGDDSIDFSSIMSEAPANIPVDNGLTGDEIIENE